MRGSQTIYRWLAVLALVATGFVSVLAAAPKTPVSFTGKVMTDNAGQYAYLSWSANRDGDAATSFDIYMAHGQTDDEAKFEKVGTVEVDPMNPPREGVYTYNVTGLEKGTYTFFIKATNADGSSAKSTIKTLQIGNNTNTEKKVVITSTPVKTGKANEKYEYKVKYETNLDGTVTFELVQGPDGMTINADGVLIWDKPVDGRYEIKIRVTVEGGGKVVTTTQMFVLEIGKGGTNEDPKKCASVYGQVTFEDPNNTFPSGAMLAFKLESVKKEDGTVVEHWVSVGKAPIQRGTYSIMIGEGSYKFRVEGESFESEWHENVYELAEAKVIEIKCDGRTEVNFVVAARPQPDMIVVVGRIYDAETMGGLKGIVIFEASGKEHGADSRYRRVVAESNADGVYEVRLQAGVNYVAFAKVIGKDNKESDYLAEYWNNTNDGTLATVLNLTDNEDGIDFPMDKRPVYNNGLSGTMKSHETGDGVAGKVIAYQIVIGKKDNGEPHVDRKKTVSVETDASGNYSFSNLVPGTYIIFGAPGDRPYVPGWMVLGGEAAHEWKHATHVEVGDVMITVQYDISLVTAKSDKGKGRVRGWVYDRRGGVIKTGSGDRVQEAASIVGSLVVARNAQGQIVDYSLSANEGAFILIELAAGAVTVTADRLGYESGMQTVTIVDENVESQVSIGLVQSTTSVEVPVNAVGTTVNLYPNPTTSTASISFSSVVGNADVRVLSMAGVVLATESVEVGAGQSTISINTASFPSGMVLVQVTNGSSTFALPLQIIR